VDKAVEVVARRLEEVSIDYAQRNSPFLIGDIRIDVVSAKDVEKREARNSDKSWQGELVFEQISGKWDKERKRS
jgi:hypothetical protein